MCLYVTSLGKLVGVVTLTDVSKYTLVFLKFLYSYELADANAKVKLSRSDSLTLKQHGESVYRLANMAGEETDTDDSSMKQDTATIHA